MKRAQVLCHTCFYFIIASLLVIGSSSPIYAQQKSQSCPESFDFALDDFNRPARLALNNSERCVKETAHFSFAPVVTHTFPFNGQTFSTEDGLTITLMFSRNPDFDHSFTYTIGTNNLVISVHRISPKAAGPKKLKLLPVEISIRFNGNPASFIFTGQESENELADKLKDFFAIGRLAAGAEFDTASERMAAFTKKVWSSFAGGDAKRSKLPLKASFPVTEMTANIFVLSFALQNHAFFKNQLCSIPKNFHESLMVISGIKENKSDAKENVKNVKVSTTSSIQEEYMLEEDAAAGGLCCWACEIVHCIVDVHWADWLCCFGSCHRGPMLMQEKQDVPKSKPVVARRLN